MVLQPGQLFFSEGFASLCERLARPGSGEEVLRTCEALLPYLSADEFVYTSTAQAVTGQGCLLQCWESLLAHLQAMDDEIDSFSTFTDAFVVINALGKVIVRREFCCDAALEPRIAQRFVGMLSETIAAASAAAASADAVIDTFCMVVFAVAFVHFEGVQRAVLDCLQSCAPIGVASGLQQVFRDGCQLTSKLGPTPGSTSDLAMERTSPLVYRLTPTNDVFFEFCRAVFKYAGSHRALPGPTRHAVGQLMMHLVCCLRSKPPQLIGSVLAGTLAIGCSLNAALLGAACRSLLMVTSVHDVGAVDGTLTQIEAWVTAAPRRALDTSLFDYDVLYRAVDALLTSEHFIILMRAFKFVWVLLPVLPAPARIHIISQLICQSFLVKFLLHWNPLVRQAFYRLMLSRMLCTAQRCTTAYIQQHWGAVVANAVSTIAELEGGLPASVPSTAVTSGTVSMPKPSAPASPTSFSSLFSATTALMNAATNGAGAASGAQSGPASTAALGAAGAASAPASTSSVLQLAFTVYSPLFRPRTLGMSDVYVTAVVGAVLRYMASWVVDRATAAHQPVPIHMRPFEGHVTLGKRSNAMAYARAALFELQAVMRLLGEHAPADIDVPFAPGADALMQ